MNRAVLTLIVLAATAIGAEAQTSPTLSVPPLISYQGNLTGATGEPLPQGEYNLTFRIWSDPHSNSTGTANLLWVERYTSVPVVAGHFNVVLGTGRTLPGFDRRRDLAIVFAGPQRYISVEVATTNLSGEIKPRQQLLTTPYALYALHGVPVGSVMAYLGVQGPPGWLICDGRVIDKATSPQLITLVDHLRDPNRVGSTQFQGPTATQARLPDLRGRVVLGTGTGAGLSPHGLGERGGAETHLLTVAEMPSHSHRWLYGLEGDDSGTGGSYNEFTLQPGYRDDPIQATGGNGAHNNMQPFLCVTYLIKY